MAHQKVRTMRDLAFGRNVEKYRKQRGKTLKWLEEKSGVKHLSRIERGIMSVKLESVFYLADALECTVYDLLEGV